MERRLSWFTVATLFVLLFVTTEALRGHNSQVDEQRSHTLGSRGSAKFDAKLVDTVETTTTGTVSTLRSRSSRERKTQSQSRRVSSPERNVDRISSKNLNDGSSVAESFGSRDRKIAEKSTDSGKISNVADSRQRASRRNDRRYLPEQNEKRESRKLEQDVTLEAPRLRKENSASRRGSSRGSSKKESDQILDNNTGPSVFAGVTENSRSRTGRKIQTAYNDKELKKQLPASRRFSSPSSVVESSTSGSRRSSNKSRGSTKNTDDTAARKKLDVSLTESESIRVDIPLALATTDYPEYTTVIGDINENQNILSRSSYRNAEKRNDDKEHSRSNTKEARNSERTKNREKSNDDVATSKTRNVHSRRGSSKFVDFTTQETIETSSTRSKSRTEGRSPDRVRNSENKSRNSGNESPKPRSRGRSLDIVSRSVSNGVSGQGEIKRRSSGDRNSPDGRARSTERRVKQVDNRVQDQDVRTRSRNKARAEVTTLKTIDVATPGPIDVTTWASELTTLSLSEPPITTIRASGQRESTRTTTESSSRPRGRKRANGQERNSGKEDYFNYGLGFRGRKFPLDGVTKNPSSPPTISTAKIDNQFRGNPGWTLRRRPGHGDKEIPTISTTSTSTVSPVREQSNEVVPSDDQSINKESSTVTPTTRRGPKKPKIEESSTVASTTSTPRRGNKTVEKANPAKTAESEESDNYPPDFKARILQLKNSSAKIPAIKSTPRTSTEGKKSSVNLFSERSRMKLELARRMVKPELNDEENVLDVTTATSPSKLRSTDVPIAEETKKVAKLAKATPSSRQDDRRKLEKPVKELKHSRARKGLDDENTDPETRTSRPKKGRVISERTVTSVSVEEDPSNYVVETVTKITEEVSSMTMDATQLRQSSSRKGRPAEVAATTLKPKKTFSATPRIAGKGFKQGSFLPRRSKTTEKDMSSTTIDSLNVPDESTKFPSLSSSTDSIEFSTRSLTKTPSALNSVTRYNFQSNYPKKLKTKLVVDTNEIPQQTTVRTSSATSRHTRKKIDAFKPFDPIPKTTTEPTTSFKRREYRPRTATYRRHSELPTTLVQSTTKVDSSTPGIAITPKTPKYHASLKSSTPTARSIPQEPQVSVRISNDTTAESGITDSSNGDTGTSNIFNPTRSAFLTGNSSLLEQLRSTVAPLLSSLGNKTPIFASPYSNVNNGSSTPRITPNGSPPRFSARYKGAELFIRKPTGGYQPTVPSITSSSTTPVTPVENIGSAPPIDISSPGEPKFVTFYHAVESVSVQNEQQAQGDSQQQRQTENVTQVDSNATNGTTGNANSNNDTTSPSTVETASPQTPDINIDTTTTRPENVTNENLNQDMESANPTITTEGSPDSNVTMAVPSTTESLSTTTDSMIETTSETNTAPSSDLPTNANIVEETTTEGNEVTADLAATTSSSTTAESMTTVVTPMINDVVMTTVTQSSDSIGTTSSGTDVSSTTESTTTAIDVSSEPAVQNRLSDMSETTEMITNMDTTITTTAQNLESSSLMSETTTTVSTESTTLQTSSESAESSTISTENSSTTDTSTESIESNTIEQSDVSSSTLPSTNEIGDLSTTTIRVTTTDLPIVTTFRTRLIDFAQDILSRLQTAIGGTTLQPDFATTPAYTTVVPVGTVTPALISDSDMSTTLSTQTESTTMTQVVPQEVTTENTITSTSADMTSSSDNAQLELREMTTEASMSMDSLSSDVSTQEAVTSDAVGSTTSSPTDSETNTQEIESSTTANAESSDLSLDVELVISPQNDSSVNTTPESPDNSTTPLVDADVTTPSPTALQDSTLESVTTGAPNDTLLTELMTIAKSLLSEAMNETQLPSLQNRLENNSSTVDSLSTTPETNTQESETSSTAVESSTTAIAAGTTQLSTDSMIENIQEVSTEVPSEQVETTSVALDATSEREEETTLSVDLSENEIESDSGSTTTELLESVEMNDTTTVDLETTLDILVTPAILPYDIEVGTIATSESTDENINESSSTIPQEIETTSVSSANVESTTLSYDFQSEPVTTQMQITTPVNSIDIAISSREQISELLTTTVRDDDNQSVTSENDVSATTMVSESLATTTMVTDNQSLITTPSNTDTETPNSQTETTLSTQNVEPTTQSTVTATNDTSSASLELTELTTTIVSTEPAATMEVVNNGETSTSQPPEIIITETVTEPALDQSVENSTNQSVEMTSTEVAVNDAEVTTNSPLLTNDTELVLDLVNDTGTTTNQPIETTTPIMPTDPPLPTDFMNSTPTIIDRLQDATPATAQGTAGTGTMQSDQTTETTIIPTIITESPTTTTSDSSNSLITESSPSGTSSSTDTTVVTTTLMTTTTTTTTTVTTTTPASSTTDRAPETTTTVETVMSSMQPTMSTDNVDINDNLISTEATTSASTMAASTTMAAETSSVMSTLNTNDATMMMTDSTSTNPPTETTVTMASSTASSTTTTMPQSTTQATPGMPVFPSATPTIAMFTTPYMGRFGGSRLTPAPRFSPSSSTKAPLRDYHVYGIYPNKTIVRKRPEDNLIDARNVDSPYVIFGIFPDGRLVRKFPNGTIIPDPPSSPVEVVFSLKTTTTTNRPPPVFFYNQANQGTFNQYQAPNYYNNRRPVANLVRNDQNFGTVDLGLTGNAISGSNGGGADFLGPLGTPGSVATTNTMGGRPNAALSPVFNGGGRIIQDRERDEASRSRESGGQRNSVYIGQDRFVNYWTNDAPNANPRVVNVNINSVASAANEGPASSTGRVPSFDNLLNNQPGGQVTAPPGFPWRDPLDQIFGITTNPPAITASIASNTLDDSNEGNQVIDARPINPFVEVFTPVSSMGPPTTTTTAATPTTTTTTTTTPPPTTTTPAPTTTTTTTTTPAPTTTTTTTTTPAPTTTTTTTTTPAPTTTTTTTTTPAPTTTTITTTTPAPTTTTTTTTPASTTTTTTTTTTTMAPTTTTTTTPAPTTTTTSTTSSIPANMRTQDAFGTTFDDLAFLNSLLQPQNSQSTQKTLNDVEQLLANKILSLALGNAGPTRSPKAIQTVNVSPNSIGEPPSPRPSSSAPIVIDLLPSSTTKPSTTSRPVTTTRPTTQKPVKLQDLAASAQTHTGSVSSTTAKAPVIVTAKSIPSKPRTTTPAPAPGFGASLLQALFGGNLFGPSTTEKPVKSTPKFVKTSPKIVEITQRPISTTQTPTTVRTVNISEIFVNTAKTNDVQASASTTAKSVSTTEKPVSVTTQPLLNNPNPRVPNVVSSTYSPEDDAKFLAALFNAVQKPNTKNSKQGTPAPALPQDDEAFLRAILSGQLTLPIPSSTASPEISDAALLAALLKAQGIEPSTPATNIREQLQLASLDKNIASLPAPSTTSQPVTSSQPVTTTTRRATTPKTRIQTTTWSPSSTYPPPLFSGFSNFGNLVDTPRESSTGGDGVRNQVVNVALGATRAFSQFLGAALSGAAQQLQSFVRNGTRIVSEAVG